MNHKHVISLICERTLQCNLLQTSVTQKVIHVRLFMSRFSKHHRSEGHAETERCPLHKGHARARIARTMRTIRQPMHSPTFITACSHPTTLTLLTSQQRSSCGAIRNSGKHCVVLVIRAVQRLERGRQEFSRLKKAGGGAQSITVHYHIKSTETPSPHSLAFSLL